MRREHDPRTGRPLINGHDRIEQLTEAELQAELTIASVHPRLRAHRLDALLHEIARRRRIATPLLG